MPVRLVCIVIASMSTAVALSACGGPPPNPSTLLMQAKTMVDSAQSLHFQLSSSNVPAGGSIANPEITGGQGDAKRPASFNGTLDVRLAGFALSLPVVSTAGTFYVKLPTSTSFTTANPADYGFADPAKLIDPQHGLSELLTQCQSAALSDDDRYNGAQLHEVSCTLPGPLIAALLTSADPMQGVTAMFGVDINSGQLRKVVLTAPFFSRNTRSTFTLILDNYGENITITAPPSAG
jgi:hypothetical protein